VEHRIEKRSKLKDTGALVGRYLEQVLKQIASGLEVKARFLLNDMNDCSMFSELLTELRDGIDKHAGDVLRKYSTDTIIDRLLSSLSILDKDLYASSFDTKISDLKSFWEDVKELESLFYCDHQSCRDKHVSVKYYDSVNKRITCSCGQKAYEWIR
jgi:hypothetical protein